ncbi:MAG: hypothetical protein QW452_10665, partial [Pyrobaculum sp.]
MQQKSARRRRWVKTRLQLLQVRRRRQENDKTAAKTSQEDDKKKEEPPREKLKNPQKQKPRKPRISKRGLKVIVIAVLAMVLGP